VDNGVGDYPFTSMGVAAFPLLPAFILTSTKSTLKFQVKANYNDNSNGFNFITNSDWFQVGRAIGNYGFMNVTTTSSTDQYSLGGGLKTQDVQEGSVKIRYLVTSTLTILILINDDSLIDCSAGFMKAEFPRVHLDKLPFFLRYVHAQFSS
jgi:hypothetical protein